MPSPAETDCLYLNIYLMCDVFHKIPQIKTLSSIASGTFNVPACGAAAAISVTCLLLALTALAGYTLVDTFVTQIQIYFRSL
uniref:Uncharacterized protein n=1 Tax=Pararge aegeria TaxID=116150 RepID=S4PGL3_9NEOP